MSSEELKAGITSADKILGDLENADPEHRQSVLDHVKDMTDKVLTNIKKHRRITWFAFGYFYAVEKRNAPELNRIIEPILRTPEYKHCRRVLSE